MSARECKACGLLLTLAGVPTRGRHANVEVEFAALPVLQCPEHGIRRYPSRDFGYEFVQAVWGVLQPAARRPLPFMKPRCCRDGTPLVSEPSARWFEGTLSLKGLSPFQARVQAPSLRCPTCGVDQLASSQALNSDVADALLSALQAASVVP